jgi:hypothetical protein
MEHGELKVDLEDEHIVVKMPGTSYRASYSKSSKSRGCFSRSSCRRRPCRTEILRRWHGKLPAPRRETWAGLVERLASAGAFLLANRLQCAYLSAIDIWPDDVAVSPADCWARVQTPPNIDKT